MRREKGRNRVFQQRIYMAFVEDNDDPLKNGRVRARVVGVHTEIKTETDTEGIKTEHLPWMSRAGSTYGSGMTGQGWWGGSPLPGSCVGCIPVDGNEMQDWVYLFTISGMRTQRSTGKGFEDPDSLWPRTDRLNTHDPSYHLDKEIHSLGESYLNVRSELLESDSITEIQYALGGGEWSELGNPGQPDHRYNFTYEGYPRDYESEEIIERNGSVIEIDSTPDHERMIWHHMTGTYWEIRPDGSLQTKIRKNHLQSVLGQQNKVVFGDRSLNVDGTNYLLVTGDEVEEFKANIIREVTENILEKFGELKRTEGEQEIHHLSGTHLLDSDSNSRAVNNIEFCPFTGLPHSTQQKTFCSP